MAWENEVALPWAPTGRISFSPIFGDRVYVVDQGTNFWRYDVTNRVWTALAPTPQTTPGVLEPWRIIASDDMNNPTTLWVRDLFLRRLARYVIATNIWTPTSFCPRYTRDITYINLVGAFAVGDIVTGAVTGATAEVTFDNGLWMRTTPLNDTDFLVGEQIAGFPSGATADVSVLGLTDNYYDIKTIVPLAADDIRVWGEMGTTNNGRCIRYTPSTDSWQVASSASTGVQVVWRGRSAGRNAAGTEVFAGEIGGAGWFYCRYDIPTDTYTMLFPPGFGVLIYACTYDSDKLWYVSGAFRQGYYDINLGNWNDDYFEADPDKDFGYGDYFGVRDNLVAIIAHARAAPPQLRTTGAFTPLVRTDPATGVT